MKKNNKKPKIKDYLLFDETYKYSKSKGNGILRRQVWVGQTGKVTRYCFAYINYRLYRVDNGRVVGYDNAHGYHHKHVMGEVIPIDYTTFEALEAEFQLEFEVHHAKARQKSGHSHYN